MTGFPCLGLLRGLRQHGGHRGQLPWHSIMPSLVHILDFHALVRLPVAVLVLASRKSMPMSWSGCVLSMTPCGRATSPATIRMPPTYVSGAIISIPPVKPCRRRRHFSPRMRIIRFVFLNLPALSLGDHLGVTASPQSPLPAGYVTLPVDNRSPPLGLMPPHSRGQGIHSIPPFSFAFQKYAREAHCR